MPVRDVESVNDRFISVYVRLLNGVADLMSVIGIPLEFTEIPGPAIALICTNGADPLSILIETYNDLLRTDPIRVIRVIPGIGTRDMDDLLLRIRYMGVGHGKAVPGISGNVCHIFRNRSFCNGVGDLGAIRIELLAILKGSFPRICFSDVLLCSLFAIRKQIEGDLLRPQAVLILSIVPDLRDRNGNKLLLRAILRHMRVGHREALFGIAAYFGCIAFRYIFLDGVRDVVSFGILLIHSLERPLPVIGGSNGNTACLLITLHQVQSNALRTDAVLVIRIIPYLGNGYLDRLRLILRHVRVGHIVTIHFRSVSFHLVLGDAVNDLLSAFVNRQILKVPAPVVAFTHRLAADRLAVRKQIDGDRLRADSVLVVLIIPGLGTGHIRKIDRAGVGNGISVHLGLIILNRILRNGIVVQISIAVYIQAFECPAPVISLCNLVAVLLFSVQEQVDRDAVRTHAGCVIPVIPDLIHRNIGFRRFMCVGYIITVYFLNIAVHRSRYDGIRDLFSIGVILSKAGDLIGPVSVFVRLDRCRPLGNAVRQYADGHLRGPFAVLVVVVIPGDRSGNRSLIRIFLHRYMRVGDVVIVIVGSFIARHCVLTDAVVDLLSVLVLIEVGKAVGPLSILLCYRLASIGSAVCQQGNGDTFRTDAVRIVPVIPGLGSGNVIKLFGRMGVVHRKPVHARLITVCLVLRDSVHNLLPFFGLRLYTEAVTPGIPACLHGKAVHLFPVSKQVQCDGFRTNTILVSGVCPEHLSANLDLVRLQRVLDGNAFLCVALDCGGIPFCHIRLYRIGDLLTVLILIQTHEAVGPFSGFVRGNYGLTHLTAVRKQFYSEALRTQTVPVIVIFPDRCARDFVNLFRRVRIDQVVPIHL